MNSVNSVVEHGRPDHSFAIPVAVLVDQGGARALLIFEPFSRVMRLTRCPLWGKTTVGKLPSNMG